MRSVWRGAISFGLVTIGVRLYSATEEHDFRFHQVHRKDSGRVRYKRVCEVCGQEVPYEDIVKGYELDDGRMVVLDAEDFQKLPVATDHAIQVLEFVPIEDVDPIYYQRSYYLEPEKNAARPYALLREALQDTGQLAVVKIAIRQRESLALLRAREDLLVLHTMLWPDEIRQPDFEFLTQDVEVRPQELKMATSLVDSMAASFKPDEFSDDYQEAMAQLIEAKAEGAEVPERPEEKGPGEVVDLMTALERSVEQARASRGGTSTSRRSAGGRGSSRSKGKTAEQEGADGKRRKTRGRSRSA
ncbi:non-homologous end joining protein Ku [Gandjariella thermophila]|uniref:Non-homologous end joining protein Ku n=1 Tax=Gandjariella thermophila TaxID=1931992 RepID=A0A4D4J169_9PSEU|nr:Ku protein [Gandjariella thermophila]GDY28548.1 non-homologous end joining protein Ku [Gandjariella thermophila]